MSTVAELMIKLGMDDAGLDKGMSSSQSKLKSWGESLRSVGTKLTAGVTLPLVGAGIAAIKWASDADEAANKVDVVFGDSAAAVKDWAASTSGSLLLSTADANEAAGTFGNLFTSMGMGQGDAADLSMSLVELGQDLSSFNNVPTDQALVALRAALVGEYEPMRALGVQLSQATVEQKALEMGIWDGNGALTAQQRVLATNALIMEQTTNAQGDAARTAKGFANQMRILRANIEDAGAKLGKVLLPYIQDLAAFLIDLVDRFDNLDPKWQKVILAAAAFAAVLGPVLIAIGFMLPAIAALGTALGFLLSPIGLLIIAIGALIGLGIYAWINDLWGVRDAVDAVVDALSVFRPMLDDLMDAFQALKEGDFAEVWDELKEAAVSALQGIGDLAGRAMDALRNMDWAGIFQGGLDILNSVVDAIRGVDWGSLIQGGWDVLYSGLQLAWDAVKDIPWESIIGKLEDFGAWLAGKVSDVDWASLIGEIKDFSVWLDEKVSDIPWSTIIGKIKDFSVWLGEKVSDIPWSTIVGKIVDFSVWLGEKVVNLDWAALVGTIADFSEWLYAKVYVLPWATLIGVIADFGAWLGEKVPSVSWSDFVPDIAWSDFIPSISWPSKDEILNAIKETIPGLSLLSSPSGGGGQPQTLDSKWDSPGGTIPMQGGEGAQSLFDKISGIARQITSTITQLATSVQSSLQQITNTFTTTAQQVGSTLQQLQSRVQQTFQQIQQQATQATNQLRSAVTSAWTQLAQQVQQQAQAMQQRVQQAFTQMQSQATSAMNQLRSSVTSAMSAMVSAASSQMSQFTSRVQSGFQQAVSAAQSGVNQIRSVVSGLSLSSQGYSIGASLGQGIASGIQAYIGTVANAAAALVSAAISAAQSAAQAHSPSRKMMQLGSDMAEGMTIGLDRGSAMVSAATAALVDIPSAMAGQTGNWGGAQQPIYISIALKSEELTDLIRNAENGGDFARSFGAQLGLYTGQP